MCCAYLGITCNQFLCVLILIYELTCMFLWSSTTQHEGVGSNVYRDVARWGFNVISSGAIAVSYIQYGHCMWRDELNTHINYPHRCYLYTHYYWELHKMEVLTGILWKICVSLTWTLLVRKKQQLQLGQLSKEQASQHFWLLCCFLFGSWCQVVANFSKIMGGVTYGDVRWWIYIADFGVRYIALDLWPNRSYLVYW